ncbi:hypothetical protein I203_102265 [Kwoniella mangroviensis CBS 8507]|uniref:uncharacterized protein n=1 Tax=Kwoniella mangroviensis CBS 8507 TaxID=1296122 RepID=UPI00080D52AE|nr:uncharacterized protein I203_03464 [Kwoniella mangroviensis CBS 8507]OCF67766.1 hypothetical protein I203_03464 [Kwoniella mangroviensis CBS 8507]
MSAITFAPTPWTRAPISTIYSQELIDPLDSTVPSAVHSPDSSYSETSPDFQSPTFPLDHSFEYDNSHEEIQAEEYDEVREQEEGDEEVPRWGMGRRPSWALSAGGSVISMSPRGSFSSRAGGSFSGSLDSRRGSSISMSLTRAPKLPFEARRKSNPSLLGFDLAEQRRRSSAKSQHSLTRRRSSALSSAMYRSRRNSSTIDAMEEARLRNIASLDLLRRRFSEVVEVTHGYSDEEDDLDGAWDYQAWSSCTEDYDTEYDDDSEIHTESYVPSPDSRNGAFLPSLFSNYPLESVAVAPTSVAPDDNGSDLSSVSPSSLLQAPRFTQDDITLQRIGTPPPSAQPNAILRDRSRPTLNRAITNYVAPRTVGVPPGAAPPRPGLARSVSNPHVTTSSSSKETIHALEIRAAGSFPLARIIPLGVSPLRESLRRQSVISDGGESSRRSSLGERRRSSLVPGMDIGSRRSTRSGSFNGSDINDASRRASLAERRISLVKESAFRRMSGPNETRRSSTRKSSEADMRRNSSRPSTSTGTGSNTVPRDSRKSSIVSIGEYGYLGPQIVIDDPKAAPQSSTSTSPVQSQEMPLPVSALKLRANAPTSIILPSYTFPSVNSLTSPTSLSPTSTTPHSNPYDPMITPTTSRSYFSSESSGSPKTPRAVNMIMDRGRPIPSPEYDAAKVLPFKDTSEPREEIVVKLGDRSSARKVLSIEDMHLVLDDGPSASNAVPKEVNVSGNKPGMKRYPTDIQSPLGSVSGSGSVQSQRPNLFRGLSFPISNDSVKQGYTFPSHTDKATATTTSSVSASSGKRDGGEGNKSYQFPQSDGMANKGKNKAQISVQVQTQNSSTLPKNRSITIIEPPSPRSARPKLGDRTSSFTRFFQSKSKKSVNQS